jgi:hypothetical protein
MTELSTGLILAGTGHRPNRLGGYNATTHKNLSLLATTVVHQLQPKYGYCGGALGWDIVWGAALMYVGIPYCMALPWPGMGGNWPVGSRSMLHRLMDKADRVHYVSEYYHRCAYILRDIYMVDNAQGVVSLLDPTATTSGTYHTVQYAETLHLPIMNLWPLYTAL